MTCELSTGLRNGMLNATGMKEALTNGVLYIYSGTQPASPDSAVSGTLLMIITKASGAFSFGTATNGLNLGAPAGGVVAKDTDVWSGVGIAAGTAGWFRLMGNATDSLGASTTLPRMDGSVGTAGSDLNLVSTTIAIGTPVTIDTFQYTLPAS